MFKDIPPKERRIIITNESVIRWYSLNFAYRVQYSRNLLVEDQIGVIKDLLAFQRPSQAKVTNMHRIGDRGPCDLYIS